jgi:hypothetical protein
MIAGENQMPLVGNGPLNVFALGKIHSLGDGRRKVNVPLLTFLALNELNFSGITHNTYTSHITRYMQQKIPAV